MDTELIAIPVASFASCTPKTVAQLSADKFHVGKDGIERLTYLPDLELMHIERRVGTVIIAGQIPKDNIAMMMVAEPDRLARRAGLEPLTWNPPQPKRRPTISAPQAVTRAGAQTVADDADARLFIATPAQEKRKPGRSRKGE